MAQPVQKELGNKAAVTVWLRAREDLQRIGLAKAFSHTKQCERFRRIVRIEPAPLERRTIFRSPHIHQPIREDRKELIGVVHSLKARHAREGLKAAQRLGSVGIREPIPTRCPLKHTNRAPAAAAGGAGGGALHPGDLSGADPPPRRQRRGSVLPVAAGQVIDADLVPREGVRHLVGVDDRGATTSWGGR